MKFHKCFGYIKLFLPIILVMIPQVVFADIGPNSPFDPFSQLSFTPPTSDVSVSLLAQLFGYVAGVDQLNAAVGSTIMGTIFMILNGGILALCSGVIAYTTVRVISETSMDGGNMSHKASVWSGVRIALSISLLVPQAGGYSLINGLIMWVVVQGVGLADMTWNAALTYLEQGKSAMPFSSQSSPYVDMALIDHPLVYNDSGVTIAGQALYINNATGTGADVTTQTAINSANNPETVSAADVFRSLVCAYTIKDAMQRNLSNNSSSYNVSNATTNAVSNPSVASGSNAIPPHNFVDDFASNNFVEAKISTSAAGWDYANSGFVQFPYLPTIPGNGTMQSYYGFNPVNSTTPIPTPDRITGACGKYSWIALLPASSDQQGATAPVFNPDGTPMYGPDGKTQVTQSVTVNNMMAAKRQGLQDMIASLDEAAQDLVAAGARNIDNTGAVYRAIAPESIYVYNDSSTASRPLFIDPNTKTPQGFYRYPGTPSTVEWAVSVDPSAYAAGGTAWQWPNASQDILNAAAAYQLDVQAAQSSPKVDNSKIYEVAKAPGWITAGGYYELLDRISNNNKMNFGSYRSTIVPLGLGSGDSGYDWPDFTPNNKYRTNFDPNVSLAVVNGFDPSSWYPDGKLGSDDTFDRVLRWTNHAFRYSALGGVKMATAAALSATNLANLDQLGGQQQFGGQSLSTLVTHSFGAGACNADDIHGSIDGYMADLAFPVSDIIVMPILSKIPMEYLQRDVNCVINTWQTEMGVDSSQISPIIKLENIGHEMMNSSLNYWTQMKDFLVAIAITSVATGGAWSLVSVGAAWGSYWGLSQGVVSAANSMVDFQAIVQKAAESFIFISMPMGLAITGPMLVNGIILGIYVPLIPFLLFSMGAISWFLAIIVLMAAAPILCFLMIWSSQEGSHWFLAREAEQFVMQLVGIFLRPTLMIVGLVVGMLLSYIGIEVLNLGFTKLFSVIGGGVTTVTSANIFGGSTVNINITDAQSLSGLSIVGGTAVSGQSNPLLQMVEQNALMIVYTFAMLSIVNLSFAPIHMLHNEVMRVVGVSSVPASGGEEKAMEGIKGGLQTFADAGASGANQTTGGMKIAGGAGTKTQGYGRKGDGKNGGDGGPSLGRH